MENVDVAIVGGGMVGLSVAAALEGSGLSVAVISDKPCRRELSKQPELRVSAINGANQEALEQLGVWEHLDAARVSPYQSMSVWDKDSFGRIQFSHDDLGAPQLGHIIENQNLVNALATTVQASANTHMVTAKINKMLWGKKETMLMLDNDDVIACRLVVGADGANSYVRQQSQLPLTFKDYGHTAIVATIETQEPHGRCARQVFTPDGPLALLPLADPFHCSIVWSQNKAVAKQLMDCDDAQFTHALNAATNSVLGVSELISDRVQFPLTMRYARQWAKQGVVIIGDAAHTIHPLAGQGVNLGMRDAFSLADTLRECHSAHKDIGELRNLRPFERARKADAAAVIAAMEGFKTLFDGNNPLKKIVRGVGLVATDTVPLLKKQWLQQAMGW